MVTFFKNHDLLNIKIKFQALYILNVMDIIFTVILYSTGMFIEANILLAPIISNSLLSVFIKVFVPGILLLILYYRMQKATDSQLRISNILINIITIIYLLICSSHIMWIFLFII